MKNKRILVIDDDPELCEEISEMLKAEGYDTTYTSDSREGLSLVQREKHDIILLDYKMPVLTGIDILKNIKKQRLPVHVFVISGRPFIEDIIKKEGVSDRVSTIIPKPIDFETLLSRIKSLPLNK